MGKGVRELKVDDTWLDGLKKWENGIVDEIGWNRCPGCGHDEARYDCVLTQVSILAICAKCGRHYPALQSRRRMSELKEILRERFE